MAKQDQHQKNLHEFDRSKGNNNPSKSVTIVTGTPKKQETYAEQAREGKDPHKQAQAMKNEWNEEPPDGSSTDGNKRARPGDMSADGQAESSGSDSNESKSSRGH